MDLKPLVLVILLFPVGADAQVKRNGGIFGFGKKSEQLSSGLFPDNNQSSQTVLTSTPVTAPAPANTAPAAPSPADGDNIFRNGSPQEVDAVSYTIQNGQKVEQDVSTKAKPRLFGFGKKEKNKPAMEDVIEPVPAPSYPDPAEAAEGPVFSSPPEAAPVIVERTEAPPAPVATPAEGEETAAPIESVPIAVEDEKSKRGRFIPFFGRKKDKDAPMVNEPTAPIPPAPGEIAEVTPAPAVTPEPSFEATSPPPVAASTQTPDPAPVASSGSPEPVFPEGSEGGDPIPSIPSFAGSPQPDNAQKKRDGFKLGDPISKLRPEKSGKPIDMTGAETIIANGEIVEPEEDIVETNIVSSGDGHREPPRIVNGVKTYSSWEDVEARSVSAADKILNSIR